MKSKLKGAKDVTVNVATSKAELAKCLRFAEMGSEVLVLYHKTAIAKIIPGSATEQASLESIKPRSDFSEIAAMKVPKQHRSAKVDSLTLLLEERGAG